MKAWVRAISYIREISLCPYVSPGVDIRSRRIRCESSLPPWGGEEEQREEEEELLLSAHPPHPGGLRQSCRATALFLSQIFGFVFVLSKFFIYFFENISRKLFWKFFPKFFGNRFSDYFFSDNVFSFTLA